MPLTQRGATDAKYKERTSRGDVFTGMAFSNAVMFAIIVATASTLHGKKIGSATRAAAALKPVMEAIGRRCCSHWVSSGPACSPSRCWPARGRPGWPSCSANGGSSPDQYAKAPVFYGLVAVRHLIGGTLLSLTSTNPIQLLVVVAIISTASPPPPSSFW